MKEEILKLIRLFQEGYDKKDIENVDSLMKQLFVKNEDISILGTSFGELCLGYEASKNLLVSDYKYWSFESIDFKNIIIQDFNEVIFVYAPASFSFTFKNDGKYGNYTDEIKEVLTKSKHLIKDLNDINWILAHFLHQRAERDRKYLFDLRVCFFIVKEEGQYKIKQIQYSVPNVSSDIRLTDEEIKKSFDFETEDFKKKAENTHPKLKRFLNQFNQAFYDLDVKELIETYFQDELFVLNYDHKIARNKASLHEIIKSIKKHWQSLELNDQNAYISQNQDAYLILTNGLAKNTWDKDEVLEMAKKDILAILDTEQTNNDKLFLIRKKITTTMKDIVVSNQYEWPIRVHLLLKKEDEDYKIQYLQFSYPYYYILENGNPYMRLINES